MTEAIISNLVKKRGEMADQLRKLQDGLIHIDATIELFQPGYKPVRVQRGDIARSMLDVLREAKQPITTPEIAEKIGSSVKRAGIALCGQRAKGMVRSEKAGKCTAWEIVR